MKNPNDTYLLEFLSPLYCRGSAALSGFVLDKGETRRIGLLTEHDSGFVRRVESA